MSVPAEAAGSRPAAVGGRRRRIEPGAAVIAVVVLVIMLVPIRRYSLAGGAGFALEPYRVVLGVLLLGLLFALVNRALPWRPIRFGVPIALLTAGLVLSIVANAPTLAQQGLVVTSVGGLANLLFVIASFALLRQVVTGEHRAILLLNLVAGSAVVVALAAVWERVTRFNVFLHFGDVLPITLINDPSGAVRGGATRAYSSSQHPIALAVLLCMVLPLAIYLLRHSSWPKNIWNRRVVYGAVIVVLMLGVVAAISRTGIVVLGVMFLVTLLVLPRVALVILSLAVPLLFVAMIVAPGTVELTLGSFLDFDELIASQYTSAGMRGAGRLADLGPVLQEVSRSPFFGLGFSSRIVNGPEANGDILDNQLLSVLLDSGVVGLAGLLVFLAVPPLLLLRYALQKDRPPQHAALAAALGISQIGYLAGAYFYDAFGFMQTLYLWCFDLAVAAWLLSERNGARSLRTDLPDRATSRGSAEPAR